MRITEARLNDICYMVLKHAFFEPSLGTSPRECDIRVCMDMAAPERITVMSAILLPNEKAGSRHDVWYEVDPGHVFDECIAYLEDHWIKEEFPQEWKTQARKEWTESIIPAILQTPEADCGVPLQDTKES